MTFDDAKTFTKVWTSRPVVFTLMPDTDFIENVCEQEKDMERIRAANSAQ